MKINIRLLYLYLFSFVGLIISVFGSIRLAQLGMKVYLFKDADIYFNSYTNTIYGPDGKAIKQTEEEIRLQEKSAREEAKKQRQREASEALAMLLVGIPLYKYHWGIIQKESKNKNQD
jgi:hypothetical protein